jgi:hypothetical protein
MRLPGRFRCLMNIFPQMKNPEQAGNEEGFFSLANAERAVRAIFEDANETELLRNGKVVHGCTGTSKSQGPQPYPMRKLNQLSERSEYKFRSTSQRRSKPAILSSHSAAYCRLRQLEFPSIFSPQTLAISSRFQP